MNQPYFISINDKCLMNISNIKKIYIDTNCSIVFHYYNDTYESIPAESLTQAEKIFANIKVAIQNVLERGF